MRSRLADNPPGPRRFVGVPPASLDAADAPPSATSSAGIPSAPFCSIGIRGYGDGEISRAARSNRTCGAEIRRLRWSSSLDPAALRSTSPCYRSLVRSSSCLLFPSCRPTRAPRCSRSRRSPSCLSGAHASPVRRMGCSGDQVTGPRGAHVEDVWYWKLQISQVERLASQRRGALVGSLTRSLAPVTAGDARRGPKGELVAERTDPSSIDHTPWLQGRPTGRWACIATYGARGSRAGIDGGTSA